MPGDGEGAARFRVGGAVLPARQGQVQFQKILRLPVRPLPGLAPRGVEQVVRPREGGRIAETTNGTQSTARDRLREARAKLRLLEIEHRTNVLNRQAKVVESLVLGRDDWWGSDLWDRVRPQSPDGLGGVMPSIASDRRHGDKWPFYRDEATHSQLRMRSRVLTETGGYGEGLLRNLVNYAVSSGFAYEVISKEKLPDADPSKPGQQSNPQLDAVISRAQDILDRVLEKNAWNGCASHDSDSPLGDTGEMEACSRVLQDGEAFIRDDDEDDGLLSFRFVEPEQVITPPGGRHDAGWSWGTQHQMEPYEDVRKPVRYYVAFMDQTTIPPEQRDADRGELVDAKRMIHVKAPGTRSTVKRGRPFFSYDTAAALERAAKLQGNLSWGAAIRAASAEIWQHDFGTADQLTQLERGLANRTRTNPITHNTEYILDSRPGQRRRIPQGQKLVEYTSDHSPSHMEAVQGDLRQAATSACAPEHVISGSAENNNYASIKEAGTPFVRFIEALQGLLQAAFQRLAWKALRYAAQCGLIPPEALSLIDIQVEAPKVVQRDALELAQEDQILIPLNVKSTKTAQMERGLDPDVENANIQDQQMMGGPGEDQGQEQPDAPDPGAALKDALSVSKAIADLQTAFYAGELPRPAVIANAVHVLRLPLPVADHLFPQVKPVKLAPDDGGAPPGMPGMEPPGGPPRPPGGPPGPPNPPGGQPPGKPPGGPGATPGASLGEGFDPDEKRDDSGKWTAGGSGKKEPPAPPKKRLYQRGEEIATHHHKGLSSGLAKLQSGELTADQAEARIAAHGLAVEQEAEKNFRSRYNNFKARIAHQYGPEAMQSPEWAAVRAQWQKHHRIVQDYISGMTVDARGEVKHFAKHGKVRQGSKNDLATSADELKQAHSTFTNEMADAFDAFRAKHKPLNEGREEEWLDWESIALGESPGPPQQEVQEVKDDSGHEHDAKGQFTAESTDASWHEPAP